MLNEGWSCVYNNADHFYFARVINDEVLISDGSDIVRRFYMKSVNGCAYNGDILWLSTSGSKHLIEIDAANNIMNIDVSVEDYVRIVKAVSGQKNSLIVDIPRESERCYAIFDCLQRTISYQLPITIDSGN